MAEREREKAEKMAEREREKAEKMAEREREKAEKMAEREREKAEKMAEREREKAEKMAQREREKAEKMAEKQRIKSQKLLMKKAFEEGIKLGKKQAKILQKKQMQRQEAKFEIKKESITKLIQVARILNSQFPNQGLHIRDIVEKYIEMHGEINPYTTEPAEPDYDVPAAIRGIVYESSPSSLQHWFRFGQRKGTAQICPWIFVNKELAIINNNYDWRKTNDEMIKNKKNSIGLWHYIDEPNALYCWNEIKYGPLPTQEQLDNAEKIGDRLVGIRNH
jgi:hypothetical protein